MLHSTEALAESKLDIFVSGDGFGLYKGVGATQLVLKIRVAGYGCDGGTTFSNEPSKCYTVTLFQGSDKHINLMRHTIVLRRALRKAARQGIVVGGTAYALHLLAGGDIPFINGSVCLSGHTSLHHCHLCEKDNKTCDMVPGKLRTFETICHSAHLSAYWPWRPFVCPCCHKAFETEQQCTDEATPWGEGPGADKRRLTHQRQHRGVRWKHELVFPPHDQEAPVGAEETTVLCKCPICILHLFLRQVDMGVHYCVREFCHTQAAADRVTDWFVIILVRHYLKAVVESTCPVHRCADSTSIRKRRHLNMEVSLWRMGKMTRYLNMSDLLLQDHFLFSLPALPGPVVSTGAFAF